MCDYCQWIEKIVAKINVAEEEERILSRTNPVIIVHGGAGEIPEYLQKYMLQEVKSTAIIAYEQLLAKCSSVDAIEQAIRRMESRNPLYCDVEKDNRIVADASIMTSDFHAGSVGYVRHVKHPISLARKILQKSEYVLVVGSGGEQFARDSDTPIVNGATVCSNIPTRTSNDKSSEEQRSNINVKHSFHSKSSEEDQGLKWEQEEEILHSDLDTRDEYEEFIPPQFNGFGAIAFDRNRKLSSGTSRIEKSRNPNGSISPTSGIIGCGIYANEDGCVSVSGEDKSIYSYGPAYKIVRQLGGITSVAVAVDTVLDNFVKEIDVYDIGAVALNSKGEASISFKSTHFPWACCRNGRIFYGCKQTDHFCEIIKPETETYLSNCTCVLSNL